MDDSLEYDQISVEHAKCVAALNGSQDAPSPRGRPDIYKKCLIRGIRYHVGFKPDLGDNEDPVIRRALNARLIMSNQVPETMEHDQYPYCIWHPMTASEATYKAVTEKYPHMRYQVGRACAVAGYTQLFLELDLLPDIAIAEEARDNGSQAIFDHIVAQYPRYAVMNDYTRTVHNENPPRASGLNGDTAVRSTLEARCKLPENVSNSRVGMGLRQREASYFDITEDWSLAEVAGPQQKTVPTHLLYTPLPFDLPAGNKDVLILSAAYYGDVDRYARLRRPDLINKEIACIVRGIYHNTMFAKWWSLQPRPGSRNYAFNYSRISSAINARFIMNNDISRISPMTPPYELPYVIWYPDRPSAKVLERLFAIQPAMRHAIARTAIILNSQDLWRKVNPTPDRVLRYEAIQSRHEFFYQDLVSRAKMKRVDMSGRTPDIGLERRNVLRMRGIFEEPRSEETLEAVSSDSISSWYGLDGIYDGLVMSMSAVERFVCSHMPPPGFIEEQEDFERPQTKVEVDATEEIGSWTVVN